MTGSAMWMEALALFGVGTVAGTVNVLAGGGSMLTLPMLIFLGLDPTVANGTNRVAIVLQNLMAVGRFQRLGLGELQPGLRLGLWTLPGGIAGAWYGASIDETALRLILVGVLAFSVITLFLPQSLLQRQALLSRRWLARPAMLAIGFYGGFIQVGVGFLFMAALRGLLGLDLVRTNAWKVLIVLLYMVPALAVFAWLDKVVWWAGFTLGAGGRWPVPGLRLSSPAAGVSAGFARSWRWPPWPWG